MIKIENVSYSYDKNQILDDISFNASNGEVTAIIGSNGTGKSTLLKNLCGILNGKGNIFLDGVNTETYSRKELAKKISYLSQFNSIDSDINVFEVVLLGRIDNLGMTVPRGEIEKVWEILRFLNVDHLAPKNISHLSGGQRQIVFIGQALAREPEVLLLDEPTNNLDMQYTYKILNTIRTLTKHKNFTTLMVLHDLNLLESTADRVIVLHHGKLYSEGTSREILTTEMFRDVYKMNVKFYPIDIGRNIMVPISPCE